MASSTTSGGIFDNGFDLWAGVSKAFGNQSADVYPGLDNVKSGQINPSIWGGVQGTGATAPGGSKYVAVNRPITNTSRQPTATEGAYDPYTGGAGGGGTGAAPVDLSSYDQAIGTYNNAINRLPGQLGVAQGNITSQFNTNQNELDSTKNQAKNSYDTSTVQNGQSLRTNKNTINDQASSGLRGLQRMLGAYGAGGSSDARYVAPQAVADQASQQRAGAGQTYAQNAQGLDTNWGNFQTEDTNSRRKLNDWRTTQMNSAQAQSETTKQDLLTKLAGLSGQRASAAGGNAAASAQPYIDQAQALNGSIDNLGRMNPTYNGVRPTYTAPTLDSYNAGEGTAGRFDPTAQGGANPYLAMLLGQQRDKNKAVV